MAYQIKVRMISKKQADELLKPEEVIRVVEETFRALGEGNVVHPVKEPIWLNESRTNMLLAMAAYLPEKKIAGVKWVNMFKEQMPGFPTCGGNLLILSNAENGQPYAIVEATSITTMRTAGGHGAVAAKYLARPDSKTMAVIGCGEEAKAGIRSFLSLFELETLRLCDLRREAMDEVVQEFKGRVNVVTCENAQQAVSGADIVLLVTTSRKPVVRYEWLERGCFVAGLYSFYDLDPSCSVKADKWVLGSRHTDSQQIVRDPLLAEHCLSMENVYADLGEIVAGKLPARNNDDEIIVFTHMGMGALDVAVGQMVYEQAVQRGIGTMVDLT